MAKRDYFHVLIVCPRESELQAARRVFEHQSITKFESAHTDLSFNLRLCRGWKSLPLNVAMVAQVRPGGIETMKLVSELAKHFSAGLIAMTGVCAGEENKYTGVEYGTVVVAKRTTTESGGLSQADGTYQPHALYIDLDKQISPTINELIQLGESHIWLEYIPGKSYCPSPRYVRELLLDHVLDNGSDGISKRQLLRTVEEATLHSISSLVIDEVLSKMQNEAEPWVCAGDEAGVYKPTDQGERYARSEAGFLREDRDIITVISASMLSVSTETESLDKEIGALKQRVANRDVKAVDHEAHFFMEQATSCFSPGLPIVMKGISDYGTEVSKMNYYEVCAASTSASFLRHFITQKNYLISKQSVCHIHSKRVSLSLYLHREPVYSMSAV